MIGIIDYGMGNLRSVYNALDYIGQDAELITDAAKLPEYERLILPGVGAFTKAMNNLRSRGFEPGIKAHVEEEKPFLGICLGMQLLATKGVESGDTTGLDVIPGEVIPMELGPDYLIPHVGWNNVDNSYSHPLFAGVKKNIDFYFVHSFHFVTSDTASILGRTDYGGPFVSIVASGSVVGVQFHPEKSQQGGLAILENFTTWDGKC